MSFFEKCKACSIMVGNGSGVLFQPSTDEYSYILTAKHNQIETDFNILGIYEHESLDIVIIKIEKIDMESPIAQLETPKDQEQYKFYGYPVNRRDKDKKIHNFDLIVTDMDGYEIVVRNIEYAEQKDVTGCSGGGIFSKRGLVGIECRMDKESDEEENNTRLRFISIKAFDEVVDKYSDELVYLDDSKNFNKIFFVEENVVDFGNGKSITIKTVPVEVNDKILNVSIYPVTFKEYDLFCNNTDSEKINTYIKHNRDKYPVVKITLDKAIEYCKWLSIRDGKAYYRLPTSTEWMSIALQNISNMPKENLDDYIWHEGNSDGEVHAIGINEPGFLGIYDLYGNVEEICSDGVTKGYSYDCSLKSILNIKKIKRLPSFSNKKIGFRIIKEKIIK